MPPKDDTVVENSEPSETINVPKILHSSEIRYILHTSQQAHGLRHTDYARYHGYCTRKLARLRKYTKVKFGTARKVNPVSISQMLANEITEDRKFLIAIFEIERCWAAAMEYKQLESSRGSHHAIQRLRKATNFAQELESCCEGLVDARTRLEVTGYYNYIKGQLEFELENWLPAETNLTQARTIYTTLSKSAVGTKHAAYINLCEELTPSLRYCAYNTGNKAILEELRKGATSSATAGTISAQLDQKLRVLIEDARGEESNRLDIVEWKISKDKKIQVPIESHLKQVKLAISALKDFRNSLEKPEENFTVSNIIEICDNSLIEIREAIQVVRSDIHSAAGKADSIDQEQSNLLLSFLQFNKTLWLSERNLYLAKDLENKNKNAKFEKPGDFARLFDLVVNQLQDINLNYSNIEHLSSTNSTILLAFRGLRSYYLSLYESTGPTTNHKNALALNRLSISCCEKALNQINQNLKSVLANSFLKALTANLKTCIEHLESTEFQLRAFITSKKSTNNQETDPNKKLKTIYGTRDNPLIENLENHEILSAKINLVNTEIINFPPKMKVTCVKPVMFDLAENFIEFPDFKEFMVTETRNESNVGARNTGWMGWWGSN